MSKRPIWVSILMLLLTCFSFSACAPPGDDYGLAPTLDLYSSNEKNNLYPVETAVQENATLQSEATARIATETANILATEEAKNTTQEALTSATALFGTLTAQVPTATTVPTRTPRPTATRTPTATTTPTQVSQVQPVGQTCEQDGGGRQKVRINNNTGSPAVLYLNGENSYICDIAPGVQKIYVVAGSYEISALMCDNQLFTFGSHIINPTWVISLECP